LIEKDVPTDGFSGFLVDRCDIIAKITRELGCVAFNIQADSQYHEKSISDIFGFTENSADLFPLYQDIVWPFYADSVYIQGRERPENRKACKEGDGGKEPFGKNGMENSGSKKMAVRAAFPRSVLSSSTGGLLVSENNKTLLAEKFLVIEQYGIGRMGFFE
jgi:hypothetical protein